MALQGLRWFPRRRAVAIVAGAACCGLLIWLSVQGTNWFRGELAYRHWLAARVLR